MISITDSEYNDFTVLVNQLTGIVLDSSKRYLIETRIGPIVEELKLTNYRQLLDQVRGFGSHLIQAKIIDAITTNETFFFREPGAFDLLRRRTIPAFLDKQIATRSREPMRIWSAACSSGQEMYSLAISAIELAGEQVIDKIKIDGSDISEQILARASLGTYSQFEINRGMPPHLLSKYFNTTPNGYRVKDELRAMCNFQKANLLKLPPPITRYNVIFCRNVSIYFSAAERINLFKGLASYLAPDGIIIVGSTEQIRDCESVLKLATDFPGCYYYQKV